MKRGRPFLVPKATTTEASGWNRLVKVILLPTIRPELTTTEPAGVPLIQRRTHINPRANGGVMWILRNTVLMVKIFGSTTNTMNVKRISITIVAAWNRCNTDERRGSITGEEEVQPGEITKGKLVSLGREPR